jgi:ASC-1-like (ASCH) protein
MARKTSINVQTPWFEEIYTGSKTVEGRIGPGVDSDFYSLGQITVKCPGEFYQFDIEIVKIRHYPTLDEYLKAEGWINCMPSADGWDDTLAKYAAITDGDRRVFNTAIINQRGIVVLIFGKRGELYHV